MSFATLVDRVRYEFMEMPGLELTMPQAVRLWNLGSDDCRFVVDALVDCGFLRWTPRRTFVRSGRTFAAALPMTTANISVARQAPSHNTVG